MKKQLNKKGFTLIEVVLVLAIGGLIFLLAFLAFQQVSRNRRDTQRRSDAGRFIAEIQNAKGDGTTITDQASLNTFVTSYLKTPAGPNGNYTFTIGTGSTAVPTGVENVVVTPGYKCNGTALSAASGNSAVQIRLENGLACRDDS